MTIPQTKLLQLISHLQDPLMLSNQAKNKIQLFHSEQLFPSKADFGAVEILFYKQFIQQCIQFNSNRVYPYFDLSLNALKLSIYILQ